MTGIFEIWGIGLGGFAFLWLVSLWRRDASVVDFWWGPGVGAMVLAAISAPLSPGLALLCAVTFLWSARLGVHLGLRRLREGREDARYAEMRVARDPGWWWKSLFIVFLLQAVLQGLLAAPLVAALAPGRALALTAPVVLAAAIALVGIAIQTVADLELDRHRAREGHGGLLTTGLRSVVRHPNYLGEIAVWTGLSAMALMAGVTWAPISALIVTLLLRYVSGVPIIEARMARSRPDAFPSYRNAVPALIPRAADLPVLLGLRARAVGRARR